MKAQRGLKNVQTYWDISKMEYLNSCNQYSLAPIAIHLQGIMDFFSFEIFVV